MPNAAAASVLRVPEDYPTIQAAIDSALEGDTVLVSAGTYAERIDFFDKQITVESVSGAAATIIDGGGVGVVVTMAADPGETPVLRGFTVRNGGGGDFPDGGIDTGGGPALIEDNTITGNSFCDDGTVTASFSEATIQNNIISGNRQQGCSGGVGGAGVSILGFGTVKVLNNEITGNSHSFAGGGIGLFAAGLPTINGNVIRNNDAFFEGGGLSIVNQSDALITNNVIVGNHASRGGGISWVVPGGATGPLVVNNTIAGNQADSGSAVFADGFDEQASLVNNILVGDGTGSVLECGDFDPNPPSIRFNDVLNAGAGPGYGGICSDQTGLNGNISADPLFVDAPAGDFHIQQGSPAVDSGTSTHAPVDDIDGDPRPLDGNGDGVAAVDMGADETPAADTVPPTITCSATPNMLWPPNHRLRLVTVDISASDESGSVAVTLVSVLSSEPDSGLGPEDVPNDIQGWATGTDDRSGSLRAERFGGSRVYTLTYQAADPAGNTVRCETTVAVTRS